MSITNKNNKLIISKISPDDKIKLIIRLKCLGITNTESRSDKVILDNNSYKLLDQVLHFSSMEDENISQKIQDLIREEVFYLGKSKEDKDFNAIIPRVLEDHYRYWERSNTSQKYFNSICQLLSEYVINTPYHSYPLWYQFTQDEYTVYRPNHDTSHSIRQYFYAKKLLELVLIEGSSEFKNAAKKFTKEEKECINLAAYLFRAGRTNESSWQDDQSNQERSRKIFILSARKIGFDESLIQHVGYLMTNWCKLSRDENNVLITDSRDHRIEEVKDHNGNIIRTKTYNGFSGEDEHTKISKEKLAKRLLDIAHHADLQRCWNIDKSENNGLVHDNLHLELEYLIGDKKLASEYTLRLMHMAAECTKRTGNKIKNSGNIYIGHSFSKEDDKSLKVKVTKDVSASIHELEHECSIFTACDIIVEEREKVKFCEEQSSVITSSEFERAEKVNSVWKSIYDTNAAVRMIEATNFKTGENIIEQDKTRALDFELNLMLNTIKFRPYRDVIKERRVRTSDFDRSYYRQQGETCDIVVRDLIAPIPVEKQTAITTNPKGSMYYENGKQKVRAVSKERGLKKLSIFSKKVSFELLSNEGKGFFYHGGFSNDDFCGIGFIVDLNKVHQKGQRYMWVSDTGTNDKPWIGENSKKSSQDWRQHVLSSRKIKGSGYGRHILNRGSKTPLKQLQYYVNNNSDFSYQNEMLLGYNKKAVQALICSKNDLENRLRLLISSHYVNKKSKEILKNVKKYHEQLEKDISAKKNITFRLPDEFKDYKPINVPLFICSQHGQGTPIEYSRAQIKYDLEFLYNNSIDMKSKDKIHILQFNALKKILGKDYASVIDSKSFADIVIKTLDPQNNEGEILHYQDAAICSKSKINKGSVTAASVAIAAAAATLFLIFDKTVISTAAAVILKTTDYFVATTLLICSISPLSLAVLTGAVALAAISAGVILNIKFYKRNCTKKENLNIRNLTAIDNISSDLRSAVLSSAHHPFLDIASTQPISGAELLVNPAAETKIQANELPLRMTIN